jgi:hypothetical protein
VKLEFPFTTTSFISISIVVFAKAAVPARLKLLPKNRRFHFVRFGLRPVHAAGGLSDIWDGCLACRSFNGERLSAIICVSLFRRRD